MKLSESDLQKLDRRARGLAKRYGKMHTYDDVYQVAWVGALEALRNATSLTWSYFYKCMRYHVIDFLFPQRKDLTYQADWAGDIPPHMEPESMSHDLDTLLDLKEFLSLDKASKAYNRWTSDAPLQYRKYGLTFLKSYAAEWVK